MLMIGTSPIESLNARFSFNRSNQISGILYETAAIYIGSIILKHNFTKKYYTLIIIAFLYLDKPLHFYYFEMLIQFFIRKHMKI